MHVQKPKKNRFRQLVPNSSGTGQHNYLTITSNHERLKTQVQQPIKSRSISRQHSIVSQSIQTGDRKKRLRTMGSLEEINFGLRNSHEWINSKLKRHRELVSRNQSQTKNGAYHKIVALAEEFKNKLEDINCPSKANRQLLIRVGRQEEQFQQQYDQLTHKTKESAVKLLNIYIGRWIKQTKRQYFQLLTQPQQQEYSEQNYLSASILPISAPSQQHRPARRNLMNIGKFLQSK